MFNKSYIIHNNVKQYKEDPVKLIELGELYQDLRKQEWSYKNIEEITRVAKEISPYTQISKNFLKRFGIESKT